MEIDKKDYYPYMPGHGVEDDEYPLEEKKFEKPDSVQSQSEFSQKELHQDNEPESLPTTSELVIDRISYVLSWVFVPLLMPVYAVILIFVLTPLNVAPNLTKISFTLVTLCLNCLIPMGLVLLLKRFGLVDDLGLNGRKERLIPYIISIVCLGATAWFFASKHAPVWVSFFFLGGSLGGFINLLVNFRWKISAHSAGIAGVVAMLLYLCCVSVPDNSLVSWLVISIALAGLLGTARIWLGRHTLLQVLAGYAVGFCSVYFLLLESF